MTAFTHPGKIVAKQRARVVNGRAYTPARTKNYENALGNAALVARVKTLDNQPLEGPVVVTVEAIFEIPLSYSKAKRQDARDGRLYPPRPDLDNVVKSVLDACNGVLWVDDKQVVEIHATKRYGRENAVKVEVEPCSKEV